MKTPQTKIPYYSYTKYEVWDAHHPMGHSKSFDTEEEARQCIEKEYKNRNKGDGHDEYWRNRESVVVKVTHENLG
jgi:hypothetical protein